MRSVWASHRDARSWRIIRSLVAIWISITIAACQSASGSVSETEALFQEELDALRVEYQFPGATAAYVLDDGRFGVVSTGFADAESRTPMQPSTRVLAASIGKTFVSATVLALEQEGQIDLDGYISDWLGDEEWFHRLPNGDAVTVRHLLSHTSGIANHVDDPAFAA
ncbi:MAG: serine hydrolase domain-containing protein, partial [Woeseiaceae bacterium]|nr:serine hydrolase domain-containing protein [Woeseiaceae bacterium]